MRKVSTLLLFALVIIGAAVVVITSLDMPPPSENVEKLIPDDQLPR